MMHMKSAEGVDLDPPVKWVGDDAQYRWERNEYLRNEQAWGKAVDVVRTEAEAEAKRKAEAAATTQGDG